MESHHDSSGEKQKRPPKGNNRLKGRGRAVRCSVVSGNRMDGGAVLKLGMESRCRRQCCAGVEKVAILILMCLETYKVTAEGKTVGDKSLNPDYLAKARGPLCESADYR